MSHTECLTFFSGKSILVPGSQRLHIATDHPIATLGAVN